MMASVSGTVQYSFPCGLRGFHVYKEIWKPKVGDVLTCIHERNNQHDRYAIAATKLLPGRLSNVTLGHLPREISRFTRFLISRGADVFVTVKDAHFRRSPLIQGGLEIPVEATVRMEASTKNIEAIERFKQLVEQHYKEPVNGQFEDCTKEVLPGVETESSSDEEDQNITTE